MTNPKRAPRATVATRSLAVAAMVLWIARFLTSGASAQPVEARPLGDWAPVKPITLTAPSNPGGGWDQTARFLQYAITENDLAPVPFEVVNRGGAGGTIGLNELVRRYGGDPYKLLISGYGMTGAVQIHGSANDLLDTTPIARLTGEFQAIAVPAASPHRTLADLIEAFRADPGNVSFGGGSAGGADQIFITLFAERLGIPASDVNYVAFTGGGEASAALMGEQVTAGVGGYAEWQPLVEAGRVRMLAVSSPTRSVDPDVPTFVEEGVDVQFQNWRAVLAAPGITEAQRAYLIGLVSRAVRTRTWRDVLARNQWQDAFLPGEAFEAFIAEDSAVTAGVLSRMGLGAGGEGYAAVGPYFFPGVVGAGLAACVLLMGAGALRAAPQAPAPAMTGEEGGVDGPVPGAARFGVAALTLGAYAVGLALVGFVLSTPFLVAGLSRAVGSRRPVLDLVVGAALTGLIVLVFEGLLNVEVP